MASLCACVGYAPEPLEPHEALRLLAARAHDDVRFDRPGPWSTDWFPLQAEVRIADGLTLGEANALALFSSPAVRAARAEARVAGAQVLQAGLLANPELFLGPRISTQDSELIFPASLSWELPLWGKRAAESDGAAARSTESQMRVIEVELETLLQVRTAFLRLDRLLREEAVLAAVSASGTQIVEWVEGLARSGEVDAVSAYLARTERDEASAALEGVRAEAARSRRALLALLGLLPDAPVTFTVDTTSYLPELPDPDRDALLSLPSLRAAEAAYAAAEAALRLEIGKQYPGIRFGPEFENDRGDASIGLGLGITLPVFDRNRGAIAAAQESRVRAREGYVARLLEASHAEATARADLATAERLLRIHTGGALRNAEEATRALDIRLRTGRADVVEILAAQRAIARARTRMLELEEQAAAARLRAAVTGGLTLRRPETSDNIEEKR
ncbi:MAG: TolC family protein [Planctomycetes bacterium]|nr:TolC family protein [Planctomycetota bacterium]